MFLLQSVSRYGLWILKFDADESALCALVVKANDAVTESEQGEVPTSVDIATRLELRSALADQDASGVDYLTVEALDAQTLGLAVAPVLGTAGAFLVCHVLNSLSSGRQATISVMRTLVKFCRWPLWRR